MCIKRLSNWTAHGQPCNSSGSCLSGHFPSWFSVSSFLLSAFATLFKLTHLALQSLDERLPDLGLYFSSGNAKANYYSSFKSNDLFLLVINVQKLKRKRRRQYTTGGTYLDYLFLWPLASWERLSFSKLRGSVFRSWVSHSRPQGTEEGLLEWCSPLAHLTPSSVGSGVPVREAK